MTQPTIDQILVDALENLQGVQQRLLKALDEISQGPRADLVKRVSA